MIMVIDLTSLGLMKTETIKLVPKHLAKYKVFGEPAGPHYAHYDLVGGRLVCISLSFPPRNIC